MSHLSPQKSDRISGSSDLSNDAIKAVGSTVQPGTVLIIEDDPGVRHLARRTLEAVGYQVLEAEDGVEGLRLVKEHSSRLALVVTDIEMPRLDGISVARELAAKHPHIGVVCMSGRLPATAFRDQIGVPLPPFLAKPFTFDDLTRTTSETIARLQGNSAGQGRGLAG
jgi:two-component system cell cycle sensor histidine kinase/response regulator CckA